MEDRRQGNATRIEFDFFAEFDRYVARNGIKSEDMPKAFEHFLREYGEAPDLKRAGRVEADGIVTPIESEDF